MKNTGITYSSAEMTPSVLPELAGLLPPLTGEQLSALEADILQNGCYSPIIVNEDLAIVDGHNRQILCEKHGIPYQMAVFHFDDMLEAMRWAVDTQKARRNLTAWELGKIALKLKPEVEAQARANQSAAGGDQKSETAKSLCLNSDEAISGESPVAPAKVDTRQELADAVGIGRDTMSRIMKIDEQAPDAVKEALDNKVITVNRGYDITRQVQDLPEEEREQAAADAITMQKVQKELKKADDETARKCKIAGQFSKTFTMANHLSASEEDVGYWIECSRMTPQEIHNDAVEARDYAGKFLRIAELLEAKLPPDFKPFEDEVLEQIPGDTDE